MENSDKAFTNAITGNTGDTVTVTCDDNFHIDKTTEIEISVRCLKVGTFAFLRQAFGSSGGGGRKTSFLASPELPICVLDETCGDVDGTGTDYACVAGVNYLMDSPDEMQCGADGCTVDECCLAAPTCDNIDGNGGGTGSGISFSSCVSGVNHLKDDLSVTCYSQTCVATDCCDVNPTCGNPDGSGTPFSSCKAGYSIKSDLDSILCATGTCDDSDCCTPNPCTPVSVEHSDKAFTNAITGNTGESVVVTCDEEFHINFDDGSANMQAETT